MGFKNGILEEMLPLVNVHCHFSLYNGRET